ncbi:hypothetical protein [Paracoccus sp. pheM1]|uniref:hypothetical protein n=1 Tax=Paracoccus sp. pheM1 TaxID=2831675 RepID=UPI001BDB839D|nr:hypothetical protein [Paracoccus sp. pheM1]MBT0778934.1 hypothetical protein [Paracoccus sp. pheM1]
MHLRDALGGVGDIDPTRPIVIGSIELGEEAAAVAAAILAGDEDPPVVTLTVREFRRPVYWTVEHAIEGRAEIVGFPVGWKDKLPTDMEKALVRAIAGLSPEHHAAVLAGGNELIIGSANACADFRKAAAAAENPMVGETTVFDDAASAFIAPGAGRGARVALDCLLNSYATSPLKFRFLELYRVMEALFLADVKKRLLDNFDAEPALALSAASNALQSELSQIVALAEPHKELFEECWTNLNDLKNTNRFVTALFKRLDNKKANGQGKWQSGAALIYQIRCAVVHAGEKDMIFENFTDGDAAILAILPTVEIAALRMLGITLG